MSATRDFDLLVVGNETEGCLAAVAAARAGARTGLVIAPGAMLGGLLTEDGLAFVDRDARHLLPPHAATQDGLFGRFLAEAHVPLVALEARRGALTLRRLLGAAGVKLIEAHWTGLQRDGARLEALTFADHPAVSATSFLDATPDGDLAEAAGVRFGQGFEEYGVSRRLGVSPLPLVHGVTPARIRETCERLQADPVLEALKLRHFGDRRFLELDAGSDYVLIGPPHLGLAYQRWRERRGSASPYPFEADGFNVAVVGPETTSWNGLIYFSEDAEALLRLSREGADDFFREEARRFEAFMREALGWEAARVELPQGVYVRQTRHAIDVRHRLTLDEIAAGYAESSVGTFCYYPDFRGFRAVSVPAPLVAHVVLDAGIASVAPNLALASRAGGYTPFAHSLCRLVQYNATLGTALGVAAAIAPGDFAAADVRAVRAELARQGILADDQTGLERNLHVRDALRADPLLAREAIA